MVRENNVTKTVFWESYFSFDTRISSKICTNPMRIFQSSWNSQNVIDVAVLASFTSDVTFYQLIRTVIILYSNSICIRGIISNIKKGKCSRNTEHCWNAWPSSKFAKIYALSKPWTETILQYAKIRGFPPPMPQSSIRILAANTFDFLDRCSTDRMIL